VQDESVTPQPVAAWWERSPGAGIALAVALGAATLWVAYALQSAPQVHEQRLLQFVTLPFLLFVPAASICGAYIALRALAAAKGAAWLALAAPAALALFGNLFALLQFANLLWALFAA
jgi:hypothetical protein